jgi:hypothetical protein
MLPKHDIVGSSPITRSKAPSFQHGGALYFRELQAYQFYFLDSFPKSFDTFTGSFAAYLFIMRFTASAISVFESLLVDNLVTRRFNTLIFSGLESLLEEYFLIRRFNISIFSDLERPSFAVITHQLL